LSPPGSTWAAASQRRRSSSPLSRAGAACLDPFSMTRAILFVRTRLWCVSRERAGINLLGGQGVIVGQPGEPPRRRGGSVPFCPASPCLFRGCSPDRGSSAAPFDADGPRSPERPKTVCGKLGHKGAICVRHGGSPRFGPRSTSAVPNSTDGSMIRRSSSGSSSAVIFGPTDIRGSIRS